MQKFSPCSLGSAGIQEFTRSFEPTGKELYVYGLAGVRGHVAPKQQKSDFQALPLVYLEALATLVMGIIGLAMGLSYRGSSM